MSTLLGIDPGLSGALAVLRVDGSAAVHDTPAGGGVYEMGTLVQLLQRIVKNDDGPLFAYIENAQAMPQQGVTSSFKIGLGYGMWQGVLSALEIPFQKVSAAAWKSAMGVQAPKATATERKHIAVAKAQQLFPALAGSLLVSKDGRSEALLIAEHGRRMRGS